MIIETIQFISYIFSPNHYNSWKLEIKYIKKISNIIGLFRLSIVIQYLNYNIFSVILYILIIFIFLICLIVILQILFLEQSLKNYKIFKIILSPIIDTLSIIFYIPITEIILLPIKCIYNKDNENNNIICTVNTIYLNILLGIIGAILLFILCIFMIYFSFFPFQQVKSSFRINSNNDIIIIIMKLLLILQYLLISNEYISLFILLLASIIMSVNCFYEPSYNRKSLEICITLKNLIIMWSYFILFLCKIFKNFDVNGFIYLLIYGYPLIIYLSFILNKEKMYQKMFLSENINNSNIYIKRAKLNIQLINSFIEQNQNIRNGRENERQQNIILLKGNIEFHCKYCTNKDCPLIKFIKNEGNFNIQRQYLLNYMNMFFNKGLKKYPKNVDLLILYILFNYTKRFNLNNVKINLIKLKKIQCSIKEKYVIYFMEQFIKDINTLKNNYTNYEDDESQIDISEQKYQKLKYLIENSIKLYAEFWGLFATNITSIINTSKLYSIGGKLNIYLNEINNIWDNELKNIKISNEFQNIVQLYSKFLLEILWDRKKSKEISKKLNNDHLNAFNLNDNTKLKEEKNNNKNNIESLLDNQDYLLFCDFDEKRNSKIVQCSISFSQLLGYQKYDLIGKYIDIIFPNVLIEENLTYLEEYIKSMHNEQNNQKELYQENDSNKNKKLIIIRNKMGYIYTLFSTIKIINDNDYSDSFLVKIKIERMESKTEYPYYVLTNSDLSIENISSSAINLGLSLDLLKKYLVKMDILVRTDKNNILNIYEDYINYEEEPKVITWVFPNIIYPKENNRKNKEEEIEELLEKSDKKKLYLQIMPIKYNNNNIAFTFKFTEIIKRKDKNKFNNDLYLPEFNKYLIMFDLLRLNYIRTLLVNNKSGLRNLRNIEADKSSIYEDSNIIKSKKIKKRKKSSIFADDSSEESEKNKNNISLTSEKIAELQGNNNLEIKDFIFSLPMYGFSIALERLRPNGDRYSASKMSEPLIKIQLTSFCKRINERMYLIENLKKPKNISGISNNININYPKSLNNNNDLFSTNINSEASSSLEISEQKSEQKDDINKGLISDSSSSLSNIFKSNSINYIRILIGFVFLETFILTLIDFLYLYNQLDQIKKKIECFNKGHIILNNILYTKYFVTEGVLANILNMDYIPVIYKRGLPNFIKSISKDLDLNRQEFSEIYDYFSSSEICKEYKYFMKNTIINITTLTSNKIENILLLFNSAMSRIPAAINDLVQYPNSINMENRDTYELMYNLINEYYINLEKANRILYNDCINATTLKMPFMIIAFIHLSISVFVLFVFLKLLSQFSLDREKPINLFLTLKKQVFENLKIAAENFSNKLLNKFFGNEDNEEESQQYYQANIQPNDINIIKFKAANEYNHSIKRGFPFIVNLIIILIFLLFYLFSFIIIFFNYRQKMNNIVKFILLFDKTSIAQTDYILNLDIFKSYLFNNSIPILNKKNTKDEFIKAFLNISAKFEESIIFNSKETSFLGSHYLEKYEQYLSGDFGELLDIEFYKEHFALLEKIKNGLKPIQTRFFEIIRYYALKYCIYCNTSKIIIDNNNISIILKEKEFKLFEINVLSELIMRFWYKNILKVMIDCFYQYKNKISLGFIITFICLIIIIILYYCIVWKTFEQKLFILLKGSSDLINLIPQEIKNIIIEKLNEN